MAKYSEESLRAALRQLTEETRKVREDLKGMIRQTPATRSIAQDRSTPTPPKPPKARKAGR
jgi:hypothetical protein